jgi:hypothetical protein
MHGGGSQSVAAVMPANVLVLKSRDRMRIVVTGKDGQVVRSLIERAVFHPDIDVIALGRPELDLLDASTIASGAEEFMCEHAL